MKYSGMMQLWKVENVKTQTKPDKTIQVSASIIGIASRGAALGYNPEHGFDCYKVFVKNFSGDISQLKRGSILYLNGNIKTSSKNNSGQWWHSLWLDCMGQDLKIIGHAPLEWDPEKHLDATGHNWKSAFND